MVLASQFLSTTIASPITSPLTPNDLARRGEVFARAEEFHLKDDDNHQVWAQLEKTFGVIADIPDDVLAKGDDATDKWLVAHGHRPTPKSKRDVLIPTRDLEIEDRNFWDVAKCVGAISAFIASNAIGAAKLLRIKKYIEALGGIKASAELLLKASTTAERLKEGGEALALLAGEILGTSMVANNC
ncbi:MAG: hypothetical protein M1836_004606 [Candelina mexicana]|nr:MAG: hypothetical protein M1836_004606 [Candelina mexicana]